MNRAISILALTLAGSAAASSLPADGQPPPPYVRTLPSTSVVYPGDAFTLFIELDNENLGGAGSDGLQWRFTNPGGFSYVSGSAGIPATNDFFAGVSGGTGYNIVNGSPFNGERTTNVPGAGPANKTGFVARYQFSVPLAQAHGIYYFPLVEQSTILVSADLNQQSRTLGQAALTVAFGGDANIDGKVDIADLLALANHWQMSGLDPMNSWSSGDFTHDGSVNSTDLGILAAHWQAGEAAALQSFAQMLPEPIVGVWLTMGGWVLRHRTRRQPVA